MTDEYRKHQEHPGDLTRQFKLIGTDAQSNPVYAPVVALEPASIGGGGTGGGGASTIADGADVAQGSTTDLSTANTVVGILKAIKAAITGTLSVSGTFWQAVQPVSGTFWQATQPVSLATNTPDVTDRAARLLGHVTVDNAAVKARLSDGTFDSSMWLPSQWWTGAPESNTLTNVLAPVASLIAAYDNASPAASKVRAMPGDQTTGLWVNVKNASLPVTGPLTDTQLRAASVPVSLATNTPDVTDRAARLLGHVTVDNASIPVTGTFFQATQPVSLATNTPDVTDRAARLLGHVTVDNASIPVTMAAQTPDVTDRAARLLGHVTVDSAPTTAVTGPLTDTQLRASPVPVGPRGSDLCVTSTAATGVACTLTIPAAAAGLFHYITLIEIQLYATAARTGGATPILVTTTNLPGSPAWDFDTAQAIGTTIRQSTLPATPIKSSVAATATTIVAPIATTGIWRITAYYYTAT